MREGLADDNIKDKRGLSTSQGCSNLFRRGHDLGRIAGAAGAEAEHAKVRPARA